jgi:hypothetical protein
MLDALGGRNQRKIRSGIFLRFTFLHHLLAFLPQAHHTPRVYAEKGETLVDTFCCFVSKR